MVRKAGSLSLLLMVALCGAAGAGMIAYYPLNEGQGTKTADATGNGNNGTLSSGVEWVTGVKGGAVRFDTAGERIVTTGLNPSAANNAMTLAAWIKWEGRGGSISQQGIIGKRLGWNPGNIKWFWQTNPAGDLLFRCDTGAGGTGLWWGNVRLVPYANEWTHVAVTWANGTAVQYVNGKETDRGTVTLGDATGDATPVTIGCVDSTNTETFIGSIDEVRIYDTALTVAELDRARTGDTTSASGPQPGTGATDVPRDVRLSWAAGDGAASHDVYLGADAAAVDGASRTDSRGVLASQGQTETSFKVATLLEYGKTYYWRVDEVNAPPSSAVHKGGTWSFTVEPYTYPLPGASLTATASSSEKATTQPINTINGSGLTNDLHSNASDTMWVSSPTDPGPVWIRYQFDKVYKLQELWVWNHNTEMEPILGYGLKDVTIETSTDGTTWTVLKDVQFAQATALAGYAHNTTVDLGGVMARSVRLTAKSNWSIIGWKQYGLSEVRFFYIPTEARAPQPAPYAENVALDATLDWRPGRDATSHKVVFGADKAAVAAGTATSKSVTEHGFTPGALDFGTTYYWKVDEVGTATYPGSVWSFTTQQYKPIDDFESYTDKAGEEIFSAWVDGFADNYKSSGSTVGLNTAVNGTFGETKIIHGGKQSMPLAYDNTKAPNFSEAERTFSPAQDWTGGGAQELVVYFRGLAPSFAETASGSIVMNAIGTDIWNNGDQFRFAYKTLSGDGTMVARVDSIFNSNVWAKGGVMIRQNVQAGSVHAFMPITPGGTSAGNGASFQRRLTAGGASANTDNTAAAVAAPYWVKIERKGDAFSGYISPDGKTWTQLGTAQTITMNNPVLIGLALCSHDAAIATSATFSNVSTTGNVTGAWQVAEIGAPQPAGNSLEGLYLSVKDSSGKTKVVQHPDAAATASMAWQQWTIPLSEFTAAGVKMTAVKSLTIGVGNKAAPKAGGTGTVYIDDISYGKPVRPVGLVASYSLEGDVKDSSGNGHDGTVMGTVSYVDGPVGKGKAMLFPGTPGNYVSLGTFNPSEKTGMLSVSLWAKWNGLSNQWQGLIGKRDTWAADQTMWQIEAAQTTGVLSLGRHNISVGSGNKVLTVGEWTHIAVTFDKTTARFYLNGVQTASGAWSFGPDREAALQFGQDSADGNAFNGALDEVKLYDLVLTPAEILALAGK